MTGLRVLLRLGRREAGRHRLRTLLVGLLIGVPVMVLAGGLVLAESLDIGGDSYARQVGGFDGVVDEQPEGAPSGIPAGARTVSVELDTVFRQKDASGRVEQLQAMAGPLADSRFAERIVTLDGRLPHSRGEVAVSPDVADRAGLEVGDRWRLDVPALDLEVVGLAGDASCSGCGDQVFLPTGGLPDDYEGGVEAGWGSSRTTQVFYDLPAGSPDAVDASWFDDANTTRDAATRAFVGYGLAAFGMVWTGLVAACGLAVGARRRRRELGILAANGADPTRLRLAVVAEGLVIGTVASVVGAALGFVAAAVSIDPVRTWLRIWGAELSVPWLSLGAAPVVGIAAAVVASLAAARDVRRATVTDLLAGRSRAVRPAPTWFAAGTVLVAVGLTVVAVLDPSDSGDQAVQFLLGLGVMSAALGTVAIGVGGVRLLTRLDRPGVATRLAARDLARQGVRSAAAVGAVALTIAGWAAIATLLHLDSAGDDIGGAPPPARTVVAVGGQSSGELFLRDGEIVDTPFSPAAERRAERAMREAGLEVRRAEVLDTVAVRFEADDLGEGRLLVVDEVLHLFGEASRRALEDGRIVSVYEGIEGVEPGTETDFGPDLVTTDGHDLPQVAVVETTPPIWADAYATAATVERLGLDDGDGLDMIVGWGRVSDDDAHRLAEALRSTYPSTTDSRLYVSGDTGWVPWALGGAATFVTLVVLALALALQRVESRTDESVLVQAGAAPSLRRHMAGARAGLLAATAVVPGVVVGTLVPLAAGGLDSIDPGTGLPWLQLLAGLVVVPTIAALIFSLVPPKSAFKVAAATRTAR